MWKKNNAISEVNYHYCLIIPTILLSTLSSCGTGGLTDGDSIVDGDIQNDGDTIFDGDEITDGDCIWEQWTSSDQEDCIGDVNDDDSDQCRMSYEEYDSSCNGECDVESQCHNAAEGNHQTSYSYDENGHLIYKEIRMSFQNDYCEKYTWDSRGNVLTIQSDACCDGFIKRAPRKNSWVLFDI